MKPVYPEVLNPDYLLQIVDNGNGTISIGTGQRILIQDVLVDTTNRSDLTFPVSPSKTYHLRFSLNGRPINAFAPPTGGFYLVDVSDPNYNPAAASEDDPQFDCLYDDALLARISVDANGIVTITPLKNARLLWFEGERNTSGQSTFTLNWSRKPSRISVVQFSDVDSYIKTDYGIRIDWGGPITRYNAYLDTTAWNYDLRQAGNIYARMRWEA